MTGLKVDNKKDIFEKEGQRFHHIRAMYFDSRGYVHYWQNRRKDRIIRELRALKSECSSLLDVGCAEGFFVDVARDMGYFALGCDISRTKLLRAKCAVIEADAQNLPFKDRAFDIVMLNRILELVPDEGRALAEVSRVARKYLIFTVPNKVRALWAKLWLALKKEKDTVVDYGWGVKERLYIPAELRRRLEGYGRVEEITAIAPFGSLLPQFQRLPVQVHRVMDNLLEGKGLGEYGLDLFALVRVE